jgi:putative Mn2+ efflux pump MntP
MNFFLVLPIALALAMDAFAVSVGLGVSQKRLSQSQVFRLASGFGLFQFLMPLLGWLAGQTILDVIKAVDHWVAFGLLFLIGSKMIFESFRGQYKENKSRGDQTRGLILLLLSVATSIDALAVGLSFAAIGQTVFYPSVVFGAVAFLMTVAGTKIGPLFGRVVGRRAELLGGLALIFIGAKVLLDHLG